MLYVFCAFGGFLAGVLAMAILQLTDDREE